jgi:hypothetical protein
MPSDKRASQRKAIKRPAYLYTRDGWPVGNCMTVDISTTGAKLSLLTSEELPSEFLISFSASGTVRRSCKLVWRNGDVIGVRFVPSTALDQARA